MVIYICFFKGATDDILSKMGQSHLLSFHSHMCICITFASSFVSSVDAPEPAPVWVRLGKDGVRVGPSGQLADCSAGYVGWEGERQGHAVPQQHQQGGRAATLQRLCLAVWDGALGSSTRNDFETRDVRKPPSSKAGHQRTLHTPDGVLSTKETWGTSVETAVLICGCFQKKSAQVTQTCRGLFSM